MFIVQNNLVGRCKKIFGTLRIVIHIYMYRSNYVCDGVSMVVWEAKCILRSLECDPNFNTLVYKGKQYGRFIVYPQAAQDQFTRMKTMTEIVRI